MHIGLRLKEARVAKGLSQRQLCGDQITRNMLSLIENGSANPSMDTLRYLAQRLDKPISYFLEEQAILSPNQACMEKARGASYEQVPEILAVYREPDPVFDREYHLLMAYACLHLAEQAILSRRFPYGLTLLEQVRAHGVKTPYYTPETERKRLILSYRCNPALAETLAEKLPDNSQELLLRAEACLQQEQPQQAAAILEAAQIRSSRWHYLRAESARMSGDYRSAVSQYLLCQESPQIDEKLELCYKELGDFQKAYEYACKNRQNGSGM